MIFIKFQGLATGIHVGVVDNKGYLCLIKKKDLKMEFWSLYHRSLTRNVLNIMKSKGHGRQMYL